MMDVFVVISGNLTGFSRFYLSPGATEVMAESKFKFDNYDYLSFLKPGGKVYSISFSPKHIAASLITPILDSFRRPGTLVVSVLIPRKYKVECVSGQNNTRAMYDLLNELNDRFYEKNYQNGMINQNPAVLMQDYYADILARYCYVSDLKQKDVSLWVDTDSLSKKIGYIASPETNIPLYLASLCRKSYDGCHYVFIAPDAPQNIDEDPEEVQMYRVRIVNKNMLLPEPVRLTQNIYPMQPGEGELDFEKNYTYQQVLAGQCLQVSAVLNGEIIEINYRFRQQEKKIRFEFYDAETSALVDFSLIRPSIECDNVNRVLTSDSCIFLGSEIYSRLTIVSKGSGYHMIDSVVDLRYISDGATVRVAVSQGCRIQKIFNAPYDISKTIRIRNHTGEEKVFFNVTEVFDEKITGQLCDWSYEITADGYEIAKGYLSSLVDSSSTFRMMPKVSVEKNAPTDSAIANPGAPKIFNGGGPLSGNGGKKRPKGLNWKKIAAVALAGIALILGIVVVTSIIKHKKEKAEAEQQITIVVDFEFKDIEDNEISDEDAENWGFVLSDTGVDEEITLNNSDNYSYEVTAPSASNAVLKFKVKMLDVEIQKDVFEESFVNIKQRADEEMKYTCTIYLALSSKQIQDINKMNNDLEKISEITETNRGKFEKKITEMQLPDEFKSLLTEKLKNKKPKTDLPPSQDDSIDTRYNELDLTKDKVMSIELDENKSEAEKKRIQAIVEVLKYVEEGKYDKITDDLIKGLSNEKLKGYGIDGKFSQQDAINSLINMYRQMKSGNCPEKTFEQVMKDKPKSFYQIYASIYSNNTTYIVNNDSNE